MNIIAMAALSAGVGLGFLLVLQGLRGKKILPNVIEFFPDGTTAAAATAWFAGAVFAGIVILTTTRWVGAGLGVVGLVVGLPWFFGGSAANSREIE